MPDRLCPYASCRALGQPEHAETEYARPCSQCGSPARHVVRHITQGKHGPVSTPTAYCPSCCPAPECAAGRELSKRG